MNHFSGLLDTAPLKVKAVVVGAMGSAAHASGSKFLPYCQATMQRMVPFLQLTGEGDEEELRGIAMDACGTFAEAVGPEAFRPYFEDLMKNAYSCVTSSSSRLRECAFLFFGVMARLYGDGFAPYLGSVVPAFLQSIAQDEIGEEHSLGASFDPCHLMPKLRLTPCSTPRIIGRQRGHEQRQCHPNPIRPRHRSRWHGHRTTHERKFGNRYREGDCSRRPRRPLCCHQGTLPDLHRTLHYCSGQVSRSLLRGYSQVSNHHSHQVYHNLLRDRRPTAMDRWLQPGL
jgi:hypothetical protein